MNTIDIILAVCLLPAIYSGLKKGLISQIISLVAIVLGVWLAYQFSAPVGEWVSGWLAASPAGIKIISFVLIFVVVFVGLALLGKLLNRALKLVMLGWLNRLLGVVFALVKYLLVLGVAVIAFDSLNAKFTLVPAETLDASHLYCWIKEISLFVFPYLKQLLFSASA